MVVDRRAPIDPVRRLPISLLSIVGAGGARLAYRRRRAPEGGTLAELMPSPLSCTFCGLFGALSVRVRVAFLLSFVDGVKTTSMTQLFCEPMVAPVHVS